MLFFIRPPSNFLGALCHSPSLLPPVALPPPSLCLSLSALSLGSPFTFLSPSRFLSFSTGLPASSSLLCGLLTVRVCTCACVFVCLRIFSHVCTCVCVCMCVCVLVCTQGFPACVYFVFVHMPLSLCVCVRACTHACAVVLCLCLVNCYLMQSSLSCFQCKQCRCINHGRIGGSFAFIHSGLRPIMSTE